MKSTVHTSFRVSTGSNAMKTKAWKRNFLIISVLIFIGSQVGNGQSAEPNVLGGERIINFPTDYSMGKLSVRDWGSTKS